MSQKAPFFTKKLKNWFKKMPPLVGCKAVQYHDEDALPLVLTSCTASYSNHVVIVVSDSAKAERLKFSLEQFLAYANDNRSVIILPEVLLGQNNQWLPENEARRCHALDLALNSESTIFVCSVIGLLNPAISPESYREQTFTLSLNQEGIEPDDIAKALIKLDYDNEAEVHAPGEFSRRGGILDIYSPLYNEPVRLDFFGDSIDGLRFFNSETQRSIKNATTVTIVPRGSMIAGAEDSEFCALNYLSVSTQIIMIEPADIENHLQKFASDNHKQKWNDLLKNSEETLKLQLLVAESADTITETGCFGLSAEIARMIPDLGGGAMLWHWQQLKSLLQRWKESGYTIVACCAEDGELERTRELLDEDEDISKLGIKVEQMRLNSGLLFPNEKLVLLSEKELFGRMPDIQRRARRYYFRSEEHDSVDLEEGCYAVHASHGICTYHGVKKVERYGEVQEFMELEFAADAKLYVPLDQLYLVGRYVGGTKKLPRRSKLGGAAWKSACEYAEEAATDLAAELLRIEAMRQHANGIAFNKAIEWENSFAASFPYQETADQQQAINEVLEDMAVAKPMDRLLCGDVGYGKTEVAMRAAFRAVMNEKQVAILVPTTILAQQHFNTFCERMAEYPINIEMLSRFRSKKSKKTILEELENGRIDIIIGTHSLLQKSVVFDKLGLLVVDEEQRFGVKHKQNLKEMRGNIDILTMTATPIPRTLYFSLSGLRHLSTIMTAPAERLPVTTVVAEYDNNLIRQAILREFEREGQVFFLHNRVQTIDGFAAKIRELVPEVIVTVAHGQMATGELERQMRSFMNGKVDVLISTTIIESGLDIPNANTIIIDRAERFGLAELYQLRGRVGRYHNQAYAYLLLPPMGSLPSEARQRLAAIRRYTHLGAGFKLAMRDLEIRGAGNLLGAEQSGHIAAVGFELYSSLLKKAVAHLSNKKLASHKTINFIMDRVSFAMQTNALDKIVAAFPNDYIENKNSRLDAYQRLNEFKSCQELDDYHEELSDRFGELPIAAENLLLTTRVKLLADSAGYFSIRVKEQKLYLESAKGFYRLPGKPLPHLKATHGKEQLQEICKILKKLQKFLSKQKR